MAYHPHHHPHTDYNHPYYSNAFVDQRSATPHSSANVNNGERPSVPQSPSSFIYNRTNAPYPSQPGGVYPSDDGGHTTAYPQPYSHPHPHHPHPEPTAYRHPHPQQDRPVAHHHPHPHHHHPVTEDQAHSSSQHVYIHPVQPKREYPPTPPSTRTQPPDSSSSSSSPYANMTDAPPSSSQQHAMLSEADDRLMRYHFPLDSQAHLRRALFHVLNAPWKRVNEREPTDETLLQFTTRNGKLYQCSFAKADGRCVKEFDRKDRVLDHIRTHIDLQPFVCRDAGCYQRFCSKPDLLQHEKNKEKTQCDQCGAKILPKNLARHKATNLCRAGRVEAFPAHLTTFR